MLAPDTKTPPTSGCPSTNCTAITPKFSGSSYVTLHDGTDNNGDGTIDEFAEGAFNTVSLDASLRSVTLNAQDTAGITTSDCLGVLEYRFCEDFNSSNGCDTGEVFRDWSENPTATANPAYTGKILMNVRCNAPQPNACTGSAQASLQVNIPVSPTNGYLGIPMSATFAGARNSGAMTCAGTAGVNRGDCFEWLPSAGQSKYDLASRLVPVTNLSNAWTGAGGLFATMTCRGTARSCTDSNGNGKCEFNTAGLSGPTTTQLSVWLVREDTGSWNEIGSVTRAGVPYSRDTNMRTAGAPVCAPYPAP